MKYPLYINGQVRDRYELQPGDLPVEYIAKTLSHINRFVGHTQYSYSVAQHAVLVSLLTPRELAFEGLHHDDTEAVWNDVDSPLKSTLPGYKDLEHRTRAEVFAPQFGLRLEEPPEVKAADLLARKLEQIYVQGRTDIVLDETLPPWLDLDLVRSFLVEVHPTRAAWAYINRHRALVNHGY